MAVFHGKDAKPKSQSSQSADTEFTEEKPFVFSVRSVSALYALCDQKNAGQTSKMAANQRKREEKGGGGDFGRGRPCKDAAAIEKTGGGNRNDFE
jgi:hypothetical protein